jgi:hypothetical protein
MREDTYTNTEADAVRHAATLGRDEDFGGGVQPPVLTPYCRVCQRGTKDYVCGPCARESAK